MSGHSEACNGSRDLCDQLYEELSARIPRLNRSQTKQWCGLYQESRTRFAYVAHKKKSDSLEIWCRGDVRKLRARRDITFRQRNSQGSGWEESFPGRFEVHGPQGLDAAVRCLVEEAYPLSATRARLSRG